MVRNHAGALEPAPNAMENKIRVTCTMHDEEYSYKRFGHLADMFPQGEQREFLLPLVLPHVPDHRRVIYSIYEYFPLLDSSNMTMGNWIQIAKDVKDAYEMFDGFVILHGTDTLAYTASALSFMLENLGKPVIGEQNSSRVISKIARNFLFLQSLDLKFPRLKPARTEEIIWLEHSFWPGTTTFPRSPFTLGNI